MGLFETTGKTTHEFLLSGASARRVAGMAAGALWVLMLFYSISIYRSAAAMRSSLYLNLFIAAIAVALTLAVLSLMRKRSAFAGVGPIALCSMLMGVGALFNSLSDAGTPVGMLLLGLGAVLSGASSAVILLEWIDVLRAVGSKTALVEMSFAGCIAFVAGLATSSATWNIACVLSVVLPCVCGYLLYRCSSEAVRPEMVSAPEPISASTRRLFVKIAAGSLLVGMLQGFFDLIMGYEAYSVFDIYGVYLLAGGFFALLVLCGAAIFFPRDGVFNAYRLSMFLLCLGCLLGPFVDDGTTYYSGAVIFGGYACFGVALCIVCIEASTSFRMSCVRIAGFALAALFTGQVAGLALGFVVQDSYADMNLASVTLLAVSLLFVSHAFVLTELDLVRVGIGEVGSRMGAVDSGEGSHESEPCDSCEIIIEKYGLTPRESDVLPLLLQGRTISRIQEALYISAGTVSTHIRHIYQKTGVSDRQGLIDLVEAETGGRDSRASDTKKAS